MNPLYAAWLAFMGVLALFFMYYIMLQNRRTQLSKLKSTNQRLGMELDDAKKKAKKLRREEETLSLQAESVLAAQGASDGPGGAPRMKKKRTSVINMLLQAKAISSEQVALALEQQQASSPDKRLEEVLVAMGFISKEKIAQVLDTIQKAQARQTQEGGTGDNGAMESGSGRAASRFEEETSFG